MSNKILTQLSGCLRIAPPHVEERSVELVIFFGKKLLEKFRRLLPTKPAYIEECYWVKKKGTTEDLTRKIFLNHHLSAIHLFVEKYRPDSKPLSHMTNKVNQPKKKKFFLFTLVSIIGSLKEFFRSDHCVSREFNIWGTVCIFHSIPKA